MARLSSRRNEFSNPSPRPLGQYVFVHVPESRFFGFEEIPVLGHAVQMATTERAVLVFAKQEPVVTLPTVVAAS